MSAFNDNEPVSSASFCTRVAPFAATVWSTDLLTNLFDVVDRYVLLHLASMNSDLNHAMVGQFHTARVLPILFLSLASMITGLLLPYWSSDWERGNNEKVVRNFITALKLNVIFFWLSALAALIASPILFQVFLDNRYTTSEACFPLALLHCVIASTVLYQSVMFRCTEANRASIVILVLSFALNVLLCCWLVPRMGVAGALYGTLGATMAMFVLNDWVLRIRGITTTREVYLILGLPFALLMPVSANFIVLAVVIVLLGRTNILIDSVERQTLDETLLPLARRLGLQLSSLWPKSATQLQQ